MILTLLDVVLPVFLVMGAGYLATRTGYFKDSAVDGLMSFTQHFAIPCLLFRATMSLDLASDINWQLLGSFYIGATASFTVCALIARVVFNSRPGEGVAIGFSALFSNSVMLGLPIMERAFGADALAPNYAIVAFHAPFCYLLGITVMEITRADGRTMTATAKLVIRAMFRNALMIGIALGFLTNFSGLTLPSPVSGAVDFMIQAALPAAIFGLGGILTRYKLQDNLAQVAAIGMCSLILHPLVAYILSVHVFDLPVGMVRAAVLTASMAPGVNTYIFATMYNRSVGVSSSAVLLLTVASIFTASFWLSILP